MSADRTFRDFDRHLQPRERSFPALELRRRTSDHPLAMVAVIAAAAFASMALVSSPGLASVGVSGLAAAKSDRLPFAQTDSACNGQAWGAETAACLEAIARHAGKDATFAVRVVALVHPDAPTVF